MEFHFPSHALWQEEAAIIKDRCAVIDNFYLLEGDELWLQYQKILHSGETRLLSGKGRHDHNKEKNHEDESIDNSEIFSEIGSLGPVSERFTRRSIGYDGPKRQR